MTQAHDEQTVERYKNTARNRILNRTLYDLDRIINGHDPEIDAPIKDGVWNRLDKMAIELATLPPQEVSVQEAAKVLRSEWEDHGEGLIGELSCYSPFDENGFFYMDADVDGEWVKFSDVKAALSALSEGKA